MMIDDGKRVAAGGARLQWHMIPIADIDLIARNTGGGENGVASKLRNRETGVRSKGRVAQIGLTGKKKVPKLGEMC
jgi:hypothetical protein